MSYRLNYRGDVKYAVQLFRPILRALKAETPGEKPLFRFVDDENLAFLNLDTLSVQLASSGKFVGQGMFLVRRMKSGLLRAYIFVNENLYKDTITETKQRLKITRVHEFIHFLSVIYYLTYFSKSFWKGKLSQRLNKSIDRLLEPTLDKLFSALSHDGETSTISELADAHFRLHCEGKTPDYMELFLHFMFSRQLFEEFFDEDKQRRFKQLMRDNATHDALALLVEALKKVCAAKDVPYDTAKNQLLEWVHLYKP